MTKIYCGTCQFFKLDTDIKTKVIVTQCFYNPPTVIGGMTNQGMALMGVRPSVNKDDFCGHHKGIPILNH